MAREIKSLIFCSDGTVSINGKVVENKKPNKGGYLEFHIKKEGQKRRLHRMIAEYFLGKPKDGRDCVDHIDGNKLNNNINNLEWVTRAENTRRAWKNGIFDEKKNLKKLTHKAVIDIYNRKNEPKKILSKEYNVSCSMVSQIQSGKKLQRITNAKTYRKTT